MGTRIAVDYPQIQQGQRLQQIVIDAGSNKSVFDIIKESGVLPVMPSSSWIEVE